MLRSCTQQGDILLSRTACPKRTPLRFDAVGGIRIGEISMARCDSPDHTKWEALRKELDELHVKATVLCDMKEELLQVGTELQERFDTHNPMQQGKAKANGQLQSIIQKLRGRESTSEMPPSSEQNLDSDLDQQVPRRRQNHNPRQVQHLKEWFNANSHDPYPSYSEKVRLAEDTGMEIRQIEYWLTNHRKRHLILKKPVARGGSSDVDSEKGGISSVDTMDMFCL